MSYPHTRIPQWFFELIPELEDSELRIMLVIYRHTLGWSKNSDFISYSQIQQESGIGSRNTVSKGLAALEGRGLVERQTTRIPSQLIKVFPTIPISPIRVVQSVDSVDASTVPALVQSVDSVDASTVPALVHSLYSQKKTTKKTLKETNNNKEITPDQEPAMLLLVNFGVDITMSKKLILLAWSRNRDISYIERVLGYVALPSSGALKPPGMVVSMIERNIDPNPPQRQIERFKTVLGWPTENELERKNQEARDYLEALEREGKL
jgi:hypothetical protein